MANYQPTYLGEIDLSEETLMHYGVKGMKWRRRKGKKRITPGGEIYRKTKTIDSFTGAVRDRTRKDTHVSPSIVENRNDLVTTNMVRGDTGVMSSRQMVKRRKKK